jgi:hypothetical protein
VALTTTKDTSEPFLTDDAWVVDAIFTVTTNDLDVGAISGQAFTSFASGTQFGVKLVNLREVLIKPTVGGAHGTLTVFGTIVDRATLTRLLSSPLGAT